MAFFGAGGRSSTAHALCEEGGALQEGAGRRSAAQKRGRAARKEQGDQRAGQRGAAFAAVRSRSDFVRPEVVAAAAINLFVAPWPPRRAYPRKFAW